MGTKKYLDDIERLFKKSHVVSADSLYRIINVKKRVKQYHRQALRNLVSQEKIKRLTKGFYTIHDDPSLAVFCFQPAYLGLQDALSIRNMWEQETTPVFITSKKVRTGRRRFLGSDVIVRRIDRKYMFGFEYVRLGDFYLPVSDIEKTFIDLVYFKQTIGGDLAQEFKTKIDRKKLKSYLKRYPKKIVDRIRKLIA